MWIKLTTSENAKIRINMDHVCMYVEHDGFTVLFGKPSDDPDKEEVYEVKETVKEIDAFLFQDFKQ